MKILCDHQTGYLPWLGLFHRISLCDIYVSLDTVKMLRSSWDDRNKIPTPNGTRWLKVPTLKGESNIFKDIKINNSLNWKKDHLKAMQHTYGKTPFFKEIFYQISELYNKEWINFMEFNEEMLRFYLKLLNIKVEFHKASDFDINGVKNEYLVNICKQFDANIYVFGQMGNDFADKNLFKRNEISIHVHKYNHPFYEQKRFGNLQEFIPNMPIIDLLFNVGIEKSQNLFKIGNISKKDLLTESLEIVEATENDCEIVFKFNNEPAARSVTFSPAPLDFEKHKKWYLNAISDINIRLYLLKIGYEDIGVLKYKIHKNEASIGIVLKPEMRGKGVGNLILKKSSDQFIKDHSNMKIIAKIKNSNIVSIRSFKKANFTELTRDNEKTVLVKGSN